MNYNKSIIKKRNGIPNHVHFFLLLLLHGFFNNIQSQITFFDKPPSLNPWISDSLYIGAGIMVKNNHEDVIIRWKKYYGSPTIGELALMVPGDVDSARFLFHSIRPLFPDDPLAVNIGSYAKGTSLVFRYIITDTLSRYTSVRQKKSYSGQNRKGIDPFISEINGMYGNQWAQTGQADTASVEVGFGSNGLYTFLNMMFEVSNAIIEIITKYKTSMPILSFQSRIFNDSITVMMFVPFGGNIKIIRNDTIDNRPDSSAFKIKYTTDNSDPRISSTAIVYTNPLTLTQTTTIKSYAYLPGDTMWFPSEVRTETYTYAPPVSNRSRIHVSSPIHPITNLPIYDIRGRLMNPAKTQSIRSFSAGVYLSGNRVDVKRGINVPGR